MDNGDAQPGEADWLRRVHEITADMERARERSQMVVRRLIAVDEDTARRMISEAGCELRVGRRDEEHFVRDMRDQPSRITVEIEGGEVTSATVG